MLTLGDYVTLFAGVIAGSIAIGMLLGVYLWGKAVLRRGVR